jgi:Ca2+-binding EF-hand superfamily protein
MIALAQPPGGPQSDPGRDGPAAREPRPPFAEAWKASDKDGDGFLSKEEFETMPRIRNLPEEKRPRVFARLDKNGDGRLGRAELDQIRRPNGGRRPPMPRLWELDVDKSGGVGFEEFKVGHLFQKLPPAKQMEIFQRLDTDRDGVITPKDKPEPPFKRESGKPHPRRADGPGKPEDPPMDPQRMIRQSDKDGDGALSFEEFRAGPAVKDLTEDEQEDRFEAMDKNHDQKLTHEDFPPPPPPVGPKGEELPPHP